MKSNKFEYGPLSSGVFKALLWLTALVGFTMPNILIYYIPFLLFLGFGLRPLLEKTGLYLYLPSLFDEMEEKRYSKLAQQRSEEIDKKYKKLKERNQSNVKL